MWLVIAERKTFLYENRKWKATKTENYWLESWELCCEKFSIRELVEWKTLSSIMVQHDKVLNNSPKRLRKLFNFLQLARQSSSEEFNDGRLLEYFQRRRRFNFSSRSFSWLGWVLLLIAFDNEWPAICKIFFCPFYDQLELCEKFEVNAFTQ